MALKAFLNQKNTATPREPGVNPVAKVEQPTVPATQKTEVVTKAVESAPTRAVEPATETTSVSSPGLLSTDRNTLKALAALQIRYGHAGEAVPYLLMIRKTNPDDMEAARLLSIALMKLKRWEEAEMVLSEMHDNDNGGGSLFSFVALRKSIVAFKVRKFRAASEWMAKFRSIKRGEES